MYLTTEWRASILCRRRYPREGDGPVATLCGVRERAPGDLALRPLPIVAAVVLVLNDHLLKRELAGSVTGKLSDLSGLVFVPILAVSALEVIRWLARREWQATERDLIACWVAVGLAFAAAKSSPVIARTFGDALGYMRYPVRHRFDRVLITHDLTDLAALPVMLVAWFDASSVIRRQRAASRPRLCRRTSDFEAQT